MAISLYVDSSINNSSSSPGNEEVTIVKSTEDTNGLYLTIAVTLPPHTDGPPLHFHDELEEEFECMEGELTLLIGKQRQPFKLYAGNTLAVAKFTRHTYSNQQNIPTKFLIRLTPPKHYEQSIQLYHRLKKDGRLDENGRPKSIFHLITIRSLQNTWKSGIPISIQRLTNKLLLLLGRLIAPIKK